MEENNLKLFFSSIIYVLSFLWWNIIFTTATEASLGNEPDIPFFFPSTFTRAQQIYDLINKNKKNTPSVFTSI